MLKCRLELQKLIGHTVSDANLRKVASLAQSLYAMQPSNHGVALVSESQANGSGDDLEFGANLVFLAPARFLVDVTLNDGELLGEESAATSLFHDGWYDHGDHARNHSAADGGNFNLSWLRDACDKIVKESTSQLSRDDLAMAICRVLDSDKPGEEVLVNSYSSPSLLMYILSVPFMRAKSLVLFLACFLHFR